MTVQEIIENNRKGKPVAILPQTLSIITYIPFFYLMKILTILKKVLKIIIRVFENRLSVVT